MRRIRTFGSYLQHPIAGLCFETPPAGGDPGASGGGGAGAPTGGSAGQPTTGQPNGHAPTGDPDRSGWIPRERFDTVNAELAKYREAEQARQAEEAKKRGDFETLQRQEREKREAAEQRAIAVARRAAFIGAAATSGKVNNVEAAFKLAYTDGLLNDIEVDDDGNPKDAAKVQAAIDGVLKAYEFLKIDDRKSRDFGGDRSGNGGQPSLDPTKMSSRDMLRAGFDEIEARRRR